MCKYCGCGLPGENPRGISAHHHDHPDDHEHGDHDHNHHRHQHDDVHHGDSQPHEHDHHHTHTHSHELDLDSRRTIELRQAILAKNDRLAERNRGFFFARG